MTPNTKNFAPLVLAVVLALLSLVVSAFTGYTSNDRATGERVTHVETQQENDGKRLDRMELKIDRTNEKLDEANRKLSEVVSAIQSR